RGRAQLRGRHAVPLPEPADPVPLTGSAPAMAIAYPVPAPAPAPSEVAPSRSGSRAYRKLVRHPMSAVGGLILLAVIASAVFAPQIAPHDPARQSLIRRFTPPVWAPAGDSRFPLGTDQIGRDILSRIIHGARTSLLVGVAAVAVSLVVGVSLGLASGFF